jgi:hypothetical protein
VKTILITLGLIAMMAGAVWADRAWSSMRVSAKTSEFNADVENLFVAIQKYKDQVGTYPTGGNLEVAKALQGHNQKNVIVIIGSKTSPKVNDRGEFLDPWGTPLRIYFSDTGVLIRSAGPNRRFDDSRTIDSDDYYWSN